MTYILLRNNKETGPLSLDELREAGLRSTDLVWVEGQSVCWLNPGEVQELKNLVGKPIAKAPVLDKTEIPASSTATLTVEKKGIYVSLPAKEKISSSEMGDLSDYQPPAGSEKYLPVNKDSSTKADAATPETRYARPLDELKELYAKNLEQQSRRRRLTLAIPPQVKKAGLYAGFIAVGIIAGIFIRNSGSPKSTVVSKNNPVQAPVSTEPENKVPAKEETAWIPDQPIPAASTTVLSDEKTLPEESDIRADAKSRSVKPKSEIKERDREPAPEGIVEKTVKEQPAEKELAPREKKAIPAEQMASLVSVKSNDYEVGSFGGIKNLEVTLTNTSGYALDRVTVEVQYLKPRDEFLKAEKIQFHAIGPNGSQTVAVPKSTRGVKVRLKVLRVESDQFNGTTAGN